MVVFIEKVQLAAEALQTMVRPFDRLRAGEAQYRLLTITTFSLGHRTLGDDWP